jgi:uncharacterized integral membrane protein (TIGR00698 family)
MAEARASVVPGLALTAVIASVALAIHALPFPPFTVGPMGRHPIDEMLFAILIGMVLRNWLPLPTALGPGIRDAVQRVLPFAIVLMGAKLDFFDVLRVSAQSLAISVVCVVLALSLTIGLCIRTGVSRSLGILIGVGTAICGGTAIAVAAPVIEANDEDTAFAITTITIFGLVSIAVFPLLGQALALSQPDFGVWAGVAIHATPQVVAAAFAFGPESGEIAVIVKLVRVLLLAPVVIGLGIWHAREKRRREQAYVSQPAGFTTLFPPFILGFVVFALANTLNLFPDFTFHLKESALWPAGSHDVSMSEAVTTTSGFLITMAMAGVGLGVNLRGLLAVGLKALWVGLFSAVVLAAFSLGLIAAT